MVGAIFRLIRPKQWSKNLLVFAALLFTGRFKEIPSVERALIAFAAMCLVSSAIYIINDLLDVERDRAHPVKKNRPIASGQVPIPVAIVLSIIFAAAALTLGFGLNRSSGSLLVVYLFLQAAYNGGLKHVALADVFLLASGFVLRAMLGATALEVGISGWLLACTGSLALMLGFGKRRHEFVLQGDGRAKSREVLAGYNLETLNAFLIMCAVCAAQSYTVYAIMSPNAHQFPGLMLTSPFVLYGVFRYVYLVFRAGEGGEPENLLFKDPHILITILLFVAVSVLALKGFHLRIIEGDVH